MPKQPKHPIECWRIHVFGHVQGVSFRAYARREAHRLGLTGSATNLPDGTVELIVEGDPDVLNAFREWCQQGSPHASVAGVAVEPHDVVGFRTFSIR